MTNLYLYLKNIIKKYIEINKIIDDVSINLTIPNVSNASSTVILAESISIVFNIWSEDKPITESAFDLRQEEVANAIPKIVEELKDLGLYNSHTLENITQYNDEEYKYCNMKYKFNLEGRI